MNGNTVICKGDLRSAGLACIRRRTSEKCPKLTMTSRSNGIGFTFRSSLFWFSLLGPSILAPIFFVLSFFVDVSSIVGPVQRAPDLFSILISPFFLGLTFWPFLWLYGFARDALIEDPSSENSVRLATIMSVIAMSVPCSLFLVAVPGEMMSSAPDAGQGTGIASFLFIIFLPLPGILGWLTGRGIAWILWP